MRFTTSQTDVYADHLDWHYRQNRTEKDVSRKITHRRWYYSLTVSNAVFVWISYRLDSVFYSCMCCRITAEICIITGVGCDKQWCLRYFSPPQMPVRIQKAIVWWTINSLKLLTALFSFHWEWNLKDSDFSGRRVFEVLHCEKEYTVLMLHVGNISVLTK